MSGLTFATRSPTDWQVKIWREAIEERGLIPAAAPAQMPAHKSPRGPSPSACGCGGGARRGAAQAPET
jgi:hypothetical protein